MCPTPEVQAAPKPMNQLCVIDSLTSSTSEAEDDSNPTTSNFHHFESHGCASGDCTICHSCSDSPANAYLHYSRLAFQVDSLLRCDSYAVNTVSDSASADDAIFEAGEGDSIDPSESVSQILEPKTLAPGEGSSGAGEGGTEAGEGDTAAPTNANVVPDDMPPELK